MPSTYTTNLGIEKIGTGEQSGTWGTTTNTNFDLIDQGVNGIVQVTLAAVGSTGSPNALTVDNGAVSDGRNKFIEFVDGGDLGGTAYVQLQPNDAEKVAFIRNSLSGSRSIIIFQGTYNASNDFEIPNGADVVLKFDGAGASATVTQVFENLTVSSATLASGVTVNAILDEDNMASDSDTALATQQSIKAYVDSQVTAQDLDIAGDTGTGAVDLDSQSLTIAGTANEIETSASGQTITVGLPNAVTIADLTATTADINGGTIDGTVIGGSSAAAGSFTTITASGEITANGGIALGDNVKATFGASDDLQIWHDGSNSYIAEAGTGNLYLRGSSIVNIQSYGGNDFIKCTASSDVKLYYSNAEKLATTSTGIDVTGTVTADGLTVDGAAIRVAFSSDSSSTIEGLQLTALASGSGKYLPAITWGYGASSPDFCLMEASRDASAGGRIHIKTATPAGVMTERFRIDELGDISFYEDTGTTAKFFWDASAETLYIGATTGANAGEKLYVDGDVVLTTGNDILFGDSDALIRGFQSGQLEYFANVQLFKDSVGTERMRIDSAGNVLVGKTTTLLADTGVAMLSSGLTKMVTDGLVTTQFNRLTSDGDIVDFRKDGTTVGSIGSFSGHVTLGNTDTGLIFNDTIKSIYAFNVSTLSNNDNAIDLGWSSVRFDDIYATNGTIQTSDRNEKQDIEVLSEAEQRVAVAAKGLLRKFRWKSAVEEKGDDARIHFGIIAQDLQAAFEAEGLDAGRYAMFISSTWTDEETGEERSRMGVRYSELLAFIIAAI